MSSADTVLLVIALTLGAAFAARHVRTPMPVVLAVVGIVAGLLWHLVPALPPISVPADRVLLVFLPPLLASAAYSLPLDAFRRNLRAIAMLAVGLVLVTMVATAVVGHATAGLPWASAFVLGAIVAPPDPVAASSVARETGLPHRFVTILEGEGLVNDAVAIVAYHLAVSAVETGDFGWGQVALALAKDVPIGVGVGLGIGWGATALRRRLDDVTLEAGLSLFAPYLTYELAERLGGSGVLAVVTFGFLLQRRALTLATPASRLAGLTVWNAVEFASTALVFVLLGLLLGEVTSAALTTEHLVPALAVAATVVGLRLAWMYVVPSLTHARGKPMQPATPSWRERTVLGWAGMRGVVSLALALALPAFPGGARGATERTTIVVLAFGVIVATLGIQGLTLRPLVGLLHAGDPERQQRDEQRMRARAGRGGLAATHRWASARGRSMDGYSELVDALCTGRIGIAAANSTVNDTRFPPGAVEASLRAQRAIVDRAHQAGRIGTTLAERLQTELDVDAMRLQGESARLTTETETQD